MITNILLVILIVVCLLVFKRLGGIQSAIQDNKIDYSILEQMFDRLYTQLAETKFDIMTKDDRIGRMTVKEAVREYKAIQRVSTEFLKSMSEVLEIVIANGVAMALSGKKQRKK